MSSTARARPSRSFVDDVLDVLSNVLFPVVVFFVWAGMTTIGTVVDQGKDPQYYYGMYPSAVANLVLRLRLDTIMHSVPYFSLIVLLLISMTVCTFRRVIPKRFPKDRAVPIENFGLHAPVESGVPRDDAASAAATALRRSGFATRTAELDGARWIFGDKHRFARYGVLVAHVGFALIAFGVFAGWLLGFKGELQIFEGTAAPVAERPGLVVSLEKFTALFEPVQTPGGVFYQASKFQSDVTVDDVGDRAVTSIQVNHPFVTASHVYFYQASYGFGGRLGIRRDGKPVTVGGTGRLMPQDQILLPGTSREIDYVTMLGPSDPSQVPVGVPLPATDEYAMWVVHDNVPTTAKPILLPVGKTVDVGDGYAVTALPPVAWTGLTYRRDPGELWVGLGAVVLVAGFVLSLLFVPVKVYVRVRPGAPAADVHVAATTTKGNAIYEGEFKAMLIGLARACAGGSEAREVAPEEAHA